MTMPANALQVGIFSRLTGYSALTNALEGPKVYDHVPQDDVIAPYVLIGDDTLVEDDTKTANGWEATLTIHTWTDAAGRKAVKALMGHVYDALHRQEDQIALEGFALLLIHCEFQQTFQEASEGSPDRYYHGVQRFRALIKA